MYPISTLTARPVAMYPALAGEAGHDNDQMNCNWELLRKQLLAQWNRLKERDLDITGPHRQRISSLIQQRYGIARELVENYLMNFERTLPMA